MFHQRDGQRIAKRHGHGGRGGGTMPVAAGFGRVGQHQRHVGLPQQGRARRLATPISLGSEAARMGDHVGQFRRLARVGQHQHHVRLRDHAQIAMAGLGRMDELRRRPGRGQRRRDLAPDMAGFAHARDDDPTPAPTGSFRWRGRSCRPVGKVGQTAQPSDLGQITRGRSKINAHAGNPVTEDVVFHPQPSRSRCDRAGNRNRPAPARCGPSRSSRFSSSAFRRCR